MRGSGRTGRPRTDFATGELRVAESTSVLLYVFVGDALERKRSGSVRLIGFQDRRGCGGLLFLASPVMRTGRGTFQPSGDLRDTAGLRRLPDARRLRRMSGPARGGSDCASLGNPGPTGSLRRVIHSLGLRHGLRSTGAGSATSVKRSEQVELGRCDTVERRSMGNSRGDLGDKSCGPRVTPHRLPLGQAAAIVRAKALEVANGGDWSFLHPEVAQVVEGLDPGSRPSMLWIKRAAQNTDVFRLLSWRTLRQTSLGRPGAVRQLRFDRVVKCPRVTGAHPHGMIGTR